MSAWRVVAEPEGNNPTLVEKAKAKVGVSTEPENTGGMVIYMTDGSSKREVTRVAWIRRAAVCKNPKNSFEKQFGIEIEKAKAAVDTMNKLLATSSEAGVLQ